MEIIAIFLIQKPTITSIKTGKNDSQSESQTILDSLLLDIEYETEGNGIFSYYAVTSRPNQ